MPWRAKRKLAENHAVFGSASEGWRVCLRLLVDVGRGAREESQVHEKGEVMRGLFTASGIVAVGAAAVLTLAPVAAAKPSKVYATDACSPSFNVALSDPTICSRRGGTPFNVFIQQLLQNKFAGAWRFSPPHVTVEAGNSLLVKNRGGETHSFSEVSQFGGGGVVPELNEVLFGTPAPPTFFIGPPSNFMPAGDEVAITPATLTPGTHLFICAIHPWMEDTVVVR
jgi:plastocyanin